MFLRGADRMYDSNVDTCQSIANRPSATLLKFHLKSLSSKINAPSHD